MWLEYVDIADGTVLDHIDASGESISYETGAARDLVGRLASIAGDDASALALLATGWSNGYVAIRSADPAEVETARAYSQEQGGTQSASAPKGGQFALGGGRVGAKPKTGSQRRRKNGSASGAKKPAGPPPDLSYDGKTGTGYGVKGGDPRVRQLQAALNRLGLSDSSGAGLAVDGKYGPRTTSSVKKLQKALGVPVDGKVTPELLKQATELKQLPEKPRRRRRRTTGNAAAGAMSRREQPARRAAILAQVSRALGEHRMVDGVCTTCPPSID